MLDNLDCLRRFARVIERLSVLASPTDLGLAPSAATDAVMRIELRRRARRLEGGTRHVTATHDGQARRDRCITLLGDVDAAEAQLSGATQ